MVKHEGDRFGITRDFVFFIDFVVSMFSKLELKNELQIRILREIASLEPAPKVWKPKSMSPQREFYMFYNFEKVVF